MSITSIIDVCVCVSLFLCVSLSPCVSLCHPYVCFSQPLFLSLHACNVRRLKLRRYYRLFHPACLSVCFAICLSACQSVGLCISAGCILLFNDDLLPLSRSSRMFFPGVICRQFSSHFPLVFRQTSDREAACFRQEVDTKLIAVAICTFAAEY